MFVEIQDRVLEPFFIEVDDNNFTVLTSETITDKESKRCGQEERTIYGHYPSLPGALQKIVTLKVHRKARVTDLKTYMAEWKKQYDKLFDAFEVKPEDAAKTKNPRKK